MRNLRHSNIPNILLLVLIKAFAYASVYYFDFVNYDEPQYVTQNPNVHGCRGRSPSEMYTFQPYWGKAEVRDDRGDGEERRHHSKPVRATILLD